MSSSQSKSARISVKVFLKCLKQSELLSTEDYEQVAKDSRAAQTAGKIDYGDQVAAELVKRKMLTRWQADKLLQMKHRSFQLGKYRLLGVVGKGGMSTVYLAEHSVMKRRCALKVLPSKRVRDSSWLGRFQREAQVGGSLDHPNIIRTYDIDHVKQGDADVHFIVMEYIEGKDLKRIVEQKGPFDQTHAADFIRQACEGLAHAHGGGLVHRDIKPANLLLEADGTIRLMDLGLVTGQSDDETSLTRAHNERVIGTADYLSPEQALDSHTVDARADLYGLGCSLYFLLTGRPPFDQGSLAQRILAHQTKEPDSLSDLVEDMSESLEEIVRRMMRKKPDDRYQSAREVADDLTDWLLANGDEQWQEKHRRLLERSSGRSVTDSQPIPVAKPVIPAYQADSGIDEAGPLAASSPEILDFSESLSESASHPELPALSDVPVAEPLADIKIDDSITGSKPRRAGAQDRWLLGIAVAMLVGLAAVVIFAAFG